MQNARHILALNAEEKQNFLNSFDIILSDCDGVVWMVAGTLIPNTGEAINLLKKAGKDIKFVSNNSVRSNEEYLRKFKAIGAENIKNVCRFFLSKIELGIIK